MLILELNYEVTAIWKPGDFDYLSVSWNYNKLFAALVQFFFLTEILLQFFGWKSHEYKKRLRPSKQKLTVS